MLLLPLLVLLAAASVEGFERSAVSHVDSWFNNAVGEPPDLCETSLKPEDILLDSNQNDPSTTPNSSTALVDPRTPRRELYHSMVNRVTRFSSGGGTANSELKTSFTFGSSSYVPVEGAFTYTSQPVAIGSTVTITLSKKAGASCTGGWNGAHWVGWDQYLTLTASDGCGPKSLTFVVGTFEADTLSANPVWSTGVTNNAWTRNTGSTTSADTGPSSAADGVRARALGLTARSLIPPRPPTSSPHKLSPQLTAPLV